MANQFSGFDNTAGATVISGWDELSGDLEAITGDLEIAGASQNPHLKRIHARATRAQQRASKLAEALRQAQRPGLERVPSYLYELPFPIGSVTITKALTDKVTNNNQSEEFRVLRLIIDEASATPAPWLVQVDDIKLKNKSQNVSAGAQLGTFYGPQSFFTPFKGMTIGAGLSVEVDFTNLDTSNSRTVFAGLFGNALL